MTKYDAILTVWNSQQPRGRLKCHRKTDPNICRAIDENIREGWGVEDMCEAITNFCAAVANKDTIWGNNSMYSCAVQRWGLFEFLHRGCQDDEKGKRWVKFTDNNWQEKDWLTRESLTRRAEQQRLQDKGEEILQESLPARKSYKNMLDNELIEVYNKASQFEQQVIARARPDVIEMIKKG